MPKISVIIPAYNAERYIAYCLDSVLKQTFSDFEIICVNDGSKDRTLDILNEYSRKDARVRVVNQENQGCGYSRNNGYELAKGDYIYFLDSDDAIHPQFLEVMYYFASTYGADMVCCGMESEPEKYSKENYSPEKIEFLLTYNPLYYCVVKRKYRVYYNPGVKFYRKEFLKDIKFIKAGFEDFSHTCEVCSLNPKTVIIKEKLSFYTVLTGSVSHSKPVPKKLFDYYAGINHICRVYGMVDDNQLKKYIRRKVIPDLLKPQLGFCRDADKDIQKEMYRIFANELKDLYNRDLIHISGSGLKKYLIYRYLIAFMAD